MTKKIHSAFSASELFSSLLMRIVCVVTLFYVIPHYDENPAVIAVIAIIAIFVILTFGEEQIIVYEDRINQFTNNLLSIFVRSNKSRIPLIDIEKAYIEEATKSTPAEIGVALVLHAVMPKGTSRNSEKSIYFLLKNGETVEYSTQLDTTSRQQIVDIVNSLLKK